MATITDINDSDLISASNEVINANFDNLNTDKIETSYLDTDTTLAANSDTKIATQKAVKSYVDSGGNPNASETQAGIVQEATDLQVTNGSATGSTGAKLFVTPAKLATFIGSVQRGSQATTFTPNGTSPTESASVTITYQKIGNFITMNIPAVTSNAGNDSNTKFISNTAIEAFARPTNTMSGLVPGVVSGGNVLAAPGYIEIASNGIITVQKDAVAGAFGNAVAMGIGKNITFTYYLQ